MATLRYSQIRVHPSGTLRYIADEDKLIKETVRDVGVVLNYMGEPESAERVYSFARHCSTNVALAEKQIELDRVRYFASKKGGVQGLKKDEPELLGLHFFLSYTEEDNPSEHTMNNIAERIARHELFRDFVVFASNHFDKKHRHTHFYVSAYSAVGKPRKLGMKKEQFNEIRRFANKLCVTEGLSIIDLKTLRYNNPEYSEWIDQVIADGIVTVHPEKEDRKKYHKQTISTKQLHYKTMKEAEERTEEEYWLMTEEQRQKKDFEARSFYAPDEDENKRWYVTGDPQERFYTVALVDKEGYQRSKLELIVRFVLFVADYEGRYIRRTDAETWVEYNAKVDTRLQGMYDYVATATKMSIKRPEEISGKIADVGRQMNALKREKSRHEKSIEKQGRIIEAYETYTYVRPVVEGVQEPDMDALREYNEAYAILAQYQILSAEAYTELRRRYEFEKQKVVDYENRMPLLKKQYNDLKKLEALASRPNDILNAIYGYSALAKERHGARGIDEILSDANKRANRNDREMGSEKSY